MLIAYLAAVVHAQSDAHQKTSPTPSPSPRPSAPPTPLESDDAAALYEDASKFLERRFAEFNRQGLPYSPARELMTREEQRELAGEHAARLMARGRLKGEDYYYLGLLYQLAGKPASVEASLRRFLSETAKHKNADKLKLQLARRVLTETAAREGLLEDAEAYFADYAQGEPRNPLDTFRLRLALAAAYDRAKQFDRAAEHARAAFELAKVAGTTGGDYVQRAQLVNAAGVTLADLLARQKRDADALAVARELLALGLTLPAANVYANAVELLVTSGHAEAVERSIEESAAHAETAPEIEVKDWLDAKPTTLASLRGRVVLLDFWATWCEPCRETMPRLAKLQDRYGERGLSVVGLTEFYGATDGKSEAAELKEIADFKKSLRLPYAVGVGANAATALRYGVRALPTTFVLDRRGVVRYVLVGGGASANDLLESVVKILLDEK
ncbi:MAG: TlpA family protein disulfide reductase [Acidobacteria bacterium]|nr:TlpA family protein disulfide reductase [Acidobacteriota bacterium]